MQMTLGGVVRAFDDWLDGPASLISDSMGSGLRGKRAHIEIDPDGKTLNLLGGSARSTAVAVRLGEAGDAETLASAVKGRNVVLGVPDQWLIRRRIELPLEAADHMDGIVASRMSSLSPLPPGESYSGHRIAEIDRVAKRLVASIAIVGRSRLAPVLEQIERAQPRGITVEAPAAGSGGAIQLTGRAGVASARRVIRRSLAAILVLAAVVAGGSLVWGNLTAGENAGRRADLEARMEKARDAIVKASNPEEVATAPEQAALDIKNQAVSVVGALDDLAAALPIHAYATEIVFVDGTLRLTGKTSNVPDVLTALESSGRFVESRLVGPATRSQDGTTSDFVLETLPLIRTGGGLH
ncbi:PilN domain-containing protein [Aquibium sp. LZ166]|uniref:PilN domain-containing protein n=1 Tax=Aquibium pacificus TaxID=3153579 RepID=A0ABV3SC80_9HYPH